MTTEERLYHVMDHPVTTEERLYQVMDHPMTTEERLYHVMDHPVTTEGRLCHVMDHPMTTEEGLLHDHLLIIAVMYEKTKQFMLYLQVRLYLSLKPTGRDGHP